MSLFYSANTLKGLHPIEPVYQGETSECGLACVVMLLRALGQKADLEELRERCEVSLQGMSLFDMAQVLAGYNVETDPVRFDSLEAVPLPAILHVGGNHFVVAMRAGGKLFQIYDPATGVQFLHSGMLREMISGYALLLGESVIPERSVYNADRSLRGWRWIKNAGGASLVLMMLMSGVLAFITPLFVGNTINDLLGPEGLDRYWAIGTVYLLAVSGAFVFERLCGRVILARSTTSGMQLIDRGFGKFINNRLRYFGRRVPGEIVSRFMAFRSASLARLLLNNTILVSALVAITATVGMAWLQPWLAIISLMSVGLNGMVTQYYLGHAQRLRYESERIVALQQQFLLETTQGVTALKTAMATGHRFQAYIDIESAALRTWRLNGDLGLRQRTLYALLAAVELIIVFSVAAPSLLSGTLSFGGFYAFVFLRQIVLSSSTAGFAAWLGIRTNAIAEARARDLFGQSSESALPAIAGELKTGIGINCMDFAHEGATCTLQDICLHISPGEKIAVTGCSGSGKTTLMTLLSGLEVPRSGVLTIDGVPADCWEDLRAHCYLQSSSDILFSGTLLENISMFSPTPDRGACQRLVETVGLAPRIARFPAGLNTHVSQETASLSAGERQRLMVARALYAQRNVHIFDEPTANLDPQSAQTVITAIISSSQAALVVTHDQAQLHQFDTVYELREGQLHLCTKSGGGS